MFEKNIILAPYTNYKIGGPAKFFFTAKNQVQLLTAIETAKKENLKVFILGGATNILFADKGFDGLVIKLEFKKIELTSPLTIRVGASVLVSELLNFLISKELSGLEWAGGLPGTVGGAVYGNAGAFGGEIKDNITSIVSINIESNKPTINTKSNAQCHFGYRVSIFKEEAFEKLASTAPGYAPTRNIVVEAELHLSRGNKKEIQSAINEKIAYRQKYQPLEYPNIGSIHKNVDMKKVPKAVAEKYASQIKTDPFPVMPAALLISEAGLKGKTIGRAQISEKHPNFIINLGDAKASDVHQLAKLIQSTVLEKFSIKLDREVVFL